MIESQMSCRKSAPNAMHNLHCHKYFKPLLLSLSPSFSPVSVKFAWSQFRANIVTAKIFLQKWLEASLSFLIDILHLISMNKARHQYLVFFRFVNKKNEELLSYLYVVHSIRFHEKQNAFARTQWNHYLGINFLSEAVWSLLSQKHMIDIGEVTRNKQEKHTLKC